MSDYDLVVRGGTVVTETTRRTDIGILNGKIAAIGSDLQGRETVDASGLLVLPGGVDSHCHIEQLRPEGGTDEETFLSASISALAGGTTTVIPFSVQFKGQPIRDTLAAYHRLARNALVDYSFHQIITDPTDAVIAEIPEIVASGIRSLKVFLTYDPLYLDDRQYVRVLAAARRAGALVTVHCENYEAIRWRSAALVADGRVAPKYHVWSRPPAVEREATHRAIALAELVDQPIQVFHVSCSEVAEEIARAQARGVKVWAETCPQYLVLTSADLDRPGFEGAKFMCSPALRDAATRDALWDDITSGVLGIVSSDHSGFSYDGPRGKRMNGSDAAFPDIPNGLPGIGSRLALLFSEGVGKGRISLKDFVRLTASNPADLFGLAPRKGRIAVGADADLALWDPTKQVIITNALLQHAIDYTPYEGMAVTGWPVMTVLRGRIVMRDGTVQAAPGSGTFLPRAPYDFIQPAGVLADGFDASAFA
ncbi:dihydropyrimidinase [Beijerinckia sp. L45]|uniref:dihydropyrimidinase n=1 Tax=Beijerinckia sp. L45 TaxID=1641855 RepID=UPI001FEDFF41|nr:dihydropyrimidinase [Beijerinckia sp. L45]